MNSNSYLEEFYGRYLLAVLILILFFNLAFSQSPKRANTWYFGEQAGLDFSHGHPVALTNSAMNAFEGSAVMSDENGNLLFYTNGGDMPYSGGIWNRNNQLMPHGDLDGASGCGSSFQSSIILPIAEKKNLYYLFTADCIENSASGGLRYSVIDMSLDGGLGDVTTKDILLHAPADESLSAIRHANGTDYWVISHKLHTDTFYVYHLTADGIAAPIKHKIGPVTPDYAGSMAVSSNGEKLAYSGLNFTALFKFDNSTGEISDYINLGVASYSASFSPDCRLLYVADGVNKRLFQFDVIRHDIPTTATQIGTTSSIGIGAMQIGPDNRIYVARFVTSNYLGVIMNPDLKGSNCKYVDDGVYLGGKHGKGGLPNFPNDVVGECINYPVENTFNHPSQNLQVAGTRPWALNNQLTTSINGNDYSESKFSEAGEPSIPDDAYFTLYPNPAGNSTTVSIKIGMEETSVDIFVMDMNGKILKEYNYDGISGSAKFKLPLDHLTNGIYTVAVQTNDSYQIERLIVLK